MLTKMIDLNMEITRKDVLYILIPQIVITPIIIVLTAGLTMGVDYIVMTVLFAIEMVLGIPCIIAMLNKLYSQSLFGEEAYTYMQFPVSNGKIIASKVITALYRMTWLAILWLPATGCMICGYCFMQDDINFYESYLMTYFMRMIDYVFAHFGLAISNGAIAFVAATIMIAIVVECFLICSEIQLAVIAAKLCGGEFNHIAVGAVVVIAAIIVYAAIAVIPIHVLLLISKGHFYIWQMVAVMIFKTAIGALFMAVSVRIMDRKYSLN